MAGTIWLVGMMGAGKSAVGEALAANLGLPFCDADDEIEREAGVGIPKIFEAEGEAGFRARERGVIAAWAGKRAVISLGGGAIAEPGQAKALAAAGTVVYLRATAPTLLERVGQGESRPLLSGLDAEGRLRRLTSLLEQRSGAYETASLVIDTDGREVGALAAELAKRLEEAA
ncbi:MAG: shikimate kinase [bacterium]|nr:shikimate kinase [bacterium]